MMAETIIVDGTPGRKRKRRGADRPIMKGLRQIMKESRMEYQSLREKEQIEKIKAKSENGLQVVDIAGKGRGIITTKEFKKDDFVVEYAGDLVSITTAKQREKLYEKDQNIGSYMYYFTYKNTQYCVDATAESGRLGRLLNHSRKGNCHTKVVAIGDKPYLILLASQDIKMGQEVTFDYGDRSHMAMQSHPWLKQ